MVIAVPLVLSLPLEEGSAGMADGAMFVALWLIYCVWCMVNILKKGSSFVMLSVKCFALNFPFLGS